MFFLTFFGGLIKNCVAKVFQQERGIILHAMLRKTWSGCLAAEARTAPGRSKERAGSFGRVPRCRPTLRLVKLVGGLMHRHIWPHVEPLECYYVLLCKAGADQKAVGADGQADLPKLRMQ